jgi:formin 2/WAS/WASL-interacting protein
MGFLDKAKKLAEQAQTKLDEVQSQYNQQQSGPSGPVTEYDKHGRPIPPEQAAAMGSAPPPARPAPPATPGVPPTGSPATPPVEAAPSAPPPPPTPGSPPVEEDRNHPSYAPPPLTSGDPLGG